VIKEGGNERGSINGRKESGEAERKTGIREEGKGNGKRLN